MTKKLRQMSIAELEAEEQKTNREILLLKAQEADEEGPLLAALRARRSEIVSEKNGRTPVLLAA